MDLRGSTASQSRKKWTDGCTERINRLRNQYWNSLPEIDIERAIVYTRIYKETEGQETVIRRAKALQAYISEKTIRIADDELIVGTEGKKNRSATVCPDICFRWLADELDTMSTRPQDPYKISEEDKRILREEIFPYWEGNSMEDYFTANMDDDLRNVGFGTNVIFGDIKSQSGGGEWAVGYEHIILKKGFKGVQEEAREYLKNIDRADPESWDKVKFYEAVIMTCDTARILGERYAKKAEELAKHENDSKRRAELLQIAKNCRRVPYNPPETFQQAIQAVWFTQILIWAEENQQSACIGRPDKYLYPFYKKEIGMGTLSELQAQEMLECLWIKMAEIIFVVSEDSAAYYSGYISFHGLTVGGVDEEGNDSVNELSYKMLQCSMDLRMHSPTINVRVNRKTPYGFMMKICELTKLGTGQPAIFFDETVIQLLQNRDIPLRAARDWSVSGCVEPNVSGSHMWAEGCRYSYATAMEWVLFNGYTKYWDRVMGVRTGNPANFNNYEEFEEAIKIQLAYLIRMSVLNTHISEKAHMLKLPKTVRSICTDGCLENGIDCINGGAMYNTGPGLETTGLADLVDSLAAIKKLVYEKKLFTMDQIVEMVKADFVGYEEQRQILVNKVPKWGNDNEYVDSIAGRIMTFCVEETGKYKSMLGYSFVTGMVPVISNIPHGEVTAALPSGRREGDGLADGISPFGGYDKNGPTAIMKSICSVDHTKCGCGNLLNMKLSPSVLNTEQDKSNFISLLRVEGKLGGYHVQFNVVNTETLLDAQKNPDNYRDLLVRVAGYSAYFTELRPEAQQAIIDRTELTSW
ncbi:MAG: formate C-acetyltransferase/glycerol dehydratase family glycyl radical enzyme [Bacillota bacterium]|nr:formate C-acetyltransferase/glycerol dehydratase family glycyl radical enzyme [Bacillota bacterium]